MTKQTEAMKLALKQAFDLGQTYWSWADSEYQSHWKKADAAKERFNQLVEDTISKALAAQQIDWEAVAADQAMTIGLLKAEQPAQQEPVASKLLKQEEEIKSLRNDLRRAHDAYCQLTREPAQRKPLTLGQKQKLWSSVGHKPTLKDRVNAYGFAIEAAHGIGEKK